MALRFRQANERDIDTLIDIHRTAFPDSRGHEPRRRNFLSNALGALSNLWVVAIHKEIVAHAFAFPLGAYFGGRRVAVTAIASVGVSPAHRGKGIARALIEHLHAVGTERGDAIALLFAFRHAFYARLGYAHVSPTVRLHSDPRSIPSTWVAEARRDPATRWDGNKETLLRTYTAVAKRQTGFLDRPQALWARIVSDPRAHVFVRRGGYVIFEYAQAEAHAPVRLMVNELVATEGARRLLLGLLGMQADQVHEITLDVSARDPIAFLLDDPDGHRHGTEALEHDLGQVAGGPMIKVLDVGRAIAARGFAKDGRVALEVGSEKLALVVQRGRARVATAKRADISVSERALASILFGGLSIHDAAALGLAHGPEAALARAEAILSLPPYFAIDTF